MFRGKLVSVIVLALAITFSYGFSSLAADTADSKHTVAIEYTSDNTDCSVIIPAKIQIPKGYCGVGFDVGFHVTNLDDSHHLTLKACDGLNANSELALKRVGVETNAVMEEVYSLLLNSDGNPIIGNKTEIGTQVSNGEEIVNRIGPVYCLAFDRDNKLTDFSENTETTMKFKVSIDSN